MIALGSPAPDFTLPDVCKNKAVSLQELKGEKGTLVFFICNHCPFVEHINEQLVQLALDYQPKGFSLVAISSNDVS